MQTRLLDFEDSFSWLQEQVHLTAVKNGFHEDWENPLKVPTMLALVGSEVSEALVAHRNREDAHVAEELADIVIRVMDMAEAMEINLGQIILNKAQINSTREYKHGNKRY